MEKTIKFAGLGLILLSISLLAYIYLPFINLFLSHPKLEQTRGKPGWYITIPKIYAQAPVVTEVNPWNRENYTKALKKGVALAKGFSKPGEEGVIYLFAHSSLPPWEITRNNVAFLRLNELQKGDEIIITKDGKKFTYKVIDQKELWPNQVSLLENIKGNILILQTCTPIGTDLKRLLVFAKPVETSSN